MRTESALFPAFRLIGWAFSEQKTQSCSFTVPLAFRPRGRQTKTKTPFDWRHAVVIYFFSTSKETHFYKEKTACKRANFLFILRHAISDNRRLQRVIFDKNLVQPVAANRAALRHDRDLFPPFVRDVWKRGIERVQFVKTS